MSILNLYIKRAQLNLPPEIVELIRAELEIEGIMSTDRIRTIAQALSQQGLPWSNDLMAAADSIDYASIKIDEARGDNPWETDANSIKYYLNVDHTARIVVDRILGELTNKFNL